MAAQQGADALSHAQMVGKAFVNQYYTVLQQTPEVVYRFYQETSKISRPGVDGEMKIATTLNGINEQIMSLNYNGFKPTIKSVVAQDSHEKGVLVLVIGFISFEASGTRPFTQSFFLAPQNKGYFVLNDILAYLDAEEELPQMKDHSLLPNPSAGDSEGHSTGSEAGIKVESEVKTDVTDHVTRSVAIEGSVEVQPSNTKQVEEALHMQSNSGKETATEHSHPQIVVHLPPSEEVPVKDTPKLSYASVVMKEPKEIPASILPIQKSTPIKPVPSVERPSQPSAVQKISFVEPASNGSDGHESEGNGSSIYVRNLPMNATPSQVEEVFKKFGAIKPSGVQVRSKQGGLCFGFVQFEESISVQDALEASPVVIGGRPVYVEEKRPGSGPNRAIRGRPMLGRGGNFRTDTGRGGRGFAGGRGNGRSDFGNGIRPRGSQFGRDGYFENSEGYQRNYQFQNGRAPRRGGIVQNNVPRLGSVVA